MKKIKLINAWDNREEVIKRCENRMACQREFYKLKKAENDKEFRDVLWNNFSWVIRHDILDVGISVALGSTSFVPEKFGRLRMTNVILKKRYLGEDDWWLDEMGYLVMPYWSGCKANHYKSNPPYYKYATT